MRRYVQQRKYGRHSCGPIAVLNALKFQGRNFTRRDLDRIAKVMGVHRCEMGGRSVWAVDRQGIRSAAKKFGIFRRMYKHSWKRIEKELWLGNALMIDVGWVKGGYVYGHVFLITAIKVHGKTRLYFVLNMLDKPCWVSRDELVEFHTKKTDQFWIAAVYVIPQDKIRAKKHRRKSA